MGQAGGVVAVPRDATLDGSAEADGYTDAGPISNPVAIGPVPGAATGAVIAQTPPRVLVTAQPYVPLSQARPFAEFTTQYETLRILGRGGEGHAVLVRNRTTGNLAVAKHSVVPQQDDARGREALALPRVSSPHVVRYRGLYAAEHPDIPGYAKLCVVTDFVEGDSLADILRMPAAERPITFDESTLWEILYQLQNAITANERAGVVHADLHPGNIIITPLEGGRFHVTVIDYGVSKVINRRTLVHATRHAPARTAFHIPPELEQPNADGEYEFVRGTDRHFAGTTLLELMVGGDIPNGTTPHALLTRLRGETHTPWSPALFNTIAGLIHQNPADRHWPVRAASSAVGVDAGMTTHALAQALSEAHAKIARLSAALASGGVTAVEQGNLASSKNALVSWAIASTQVRAAKSDKEKKLTSRISMSSIVVGSSGLIVSMPMAWFLGKTISASLLVAGVLCGWWFLRTINESIKLSTRIQALRKKTPWPIYYDASKRQYHEEYIRGGGVYAVDTAEDIKRHLDQNGASDIFVNGVRIYQVGKILKHGDSTLLHTEILFPGDATPVAITFHAASDDLWGQLAAARDTGKPLLLHARASKISADPSRGDMPIDIHAKEIRHLAPALMIVAPR